MTTKTTTQQLESPKDASLVLSSDGESFNPMSLETNCNVNSPIENSKPLCHWGSGYNLEQSKASMSSNRIFVLSFTGKPLTPCRTSKARKLLVGGVAKVVWNKFGEFGIQMIVSTREFTPKTVLGIDNGTKFEGYSLISGSENLLNVMWLLPNKNKQVKKMQDRRRLRRTRRSRNCRREELRSNNRKMDGFIAPSQLVIVKSRLKVIEEFFKCYPINKVAIEDVRFNHRDSRNGKNFSTIERGKNIIKLFIIEKIGIDNYITFRGFESQKIRNNLGLKKSSNKSSETFNSHCVDSFSIASEICESEPNFNIKVVDDTYRPIRRQLHYTQFAKNGIRRKYSTGNFKGIRKGCICEFGQIVGGTRAKTQTNFYIRNLDNKRINRKNITWLSHNFKIKLGDMDI